MAYCKTNNAEIYYEIIGEGSVPLFFLNGILGNTKLVQKAGIPEILCERFTCVLHNYRGQDFTKFSGEFSFDDLIKDLWALQEELGVSQINLVGDAFGASLALAYAHDYPKRVNRMVLSAGASLKDINLAFKIASWVKALEKTDLETLYDILFPDFFTREFVEKNLMELSGLKELLVGQKHKQSVLALLEAVLGRGVRRDYTALPHPALVIQGREDSIIKPYHGRNMASMLPRAIYREADGAHVLLMENPNWYAAEIVNFLDGAEDWIKRSQRDD